MGAASTQISTGPASLGSRSFKTLSALWPLPALLAWAGAWAAFTGLQSAGLPAGLAALCASGIAMAFALGGSTRLRRWVVALGFPVSVLAVAAGGAGGGLAVPAWAWLLPLGVLALAYPMSAWRDAPLFPTPTGALDGLPASAPLPDGATVLDAGCGLGHGLVALRRAYPQARLIGVERSAPIAWAAAWRCRRAGVSASVERGDMWAGDWRGCAMVYLFQRPESLPRAIEKARAELAPGAWLASLEFPALGVAPQAVLTCPDGRALWLYQAPFHPPETTRPAASSVTAGAHSGARAPSGSRRQRR